MFLFDCGKRNLLMYKVYCKTSKMSIIIVKGWLFNEIYGERGAIASTNAKQASKAEAVE